MVKRLQTLQMILLQPRLFKNYLLTSHLPLLHCRYLFYLTYQCVLVNEIYSDFPVLAHLIIHLHLRFRHRNHSSLRFELNLQLQDQKFFEIFIAKGLMI